MQSWLRITLLIVCGAIGIAATLTVRRIGPLASLRRSKSRECRRSPRSWSTSRRRRRRLRRSPQPRLLLHPIATRSRTQVGQLEETLQTRRIVASPRAIDDAHALAAMQDRIDEPRPVASFVAQVPSTPIAAPADPAAEEQPEQPEVPADDALRAQKVGEPHADIRRDEGDESLTINIQNTDIRTVLETISRETGLNIIASKKVTGPVTAT